MVQNFHLSERITNNILKAEKSNFAGKSAGHRQQYESQYRPVPCGCDHWGIFVGGCRSWLSDYLRQSGIQDGLGDDEHCTALPDRNGAVSGACTAGEKSSGNDGTMNGISDEVKKWLEQKYCSSQKSLDFENFIISRQQRYRHHMHTGC